MAAQAADIVVAFIRAHPDGSFQVDGGLSGFAGSVAAEAGIAVTGVPEGVGEVDESFTTVSGERLDVVTGGLIVAAAYADRDATVDVLADNPCDGPSLPSRPAGCCRSPGRSTTAARTSPPSYSLTPSQVPLTRP